MSYSFPTDLVFEKRNEMETILIPNHLGTLGDNFLTDIKIKFAFQGRSVMCYCRFILCFLLVAYYPASSCFVMSKLHVIGFCSNFFGTQPLPWVCEQVGPGSLVQAPLDEAVPSSL
jgi:hypothetical protein